MSAAITSKDFATLRAAAALQGYRIVRSDSVDGTVVYCLERFGLVREMQPAQLIEMFSTEAVQP
ncbi:hypothetical protein ACHEXL_06880 [Limnohabitans sp. yimb22184]|uniref:hypothetical protein n=1 Tax=Limnohabitans sp. YIMB22184 TaxID=3374104 RepID=UPI003A8878CD